MMSLEGESEKKMEARVTQVTYLSLHHFQKAANITLPVASRHACMQA